ncbi:MAG: isoaspartyl peptidase/L-asparaginase [Chitinophagales bacterium]|nr:isoaspartyl peptidase/L-asparaginase [Chitinophagales bacterium]
MLVGIHGGAGKLSESRYKGELLEDCKKALTNSLKSAFELIQKGATAVEAVESAVVIMEDSGCFNAGRGSVYSHNETHEFDASIMDGSTLNCGAVASVPEIKNPIMLAKIVMEESRHVLISGREALQFAEQYHIERESKEYFHSDYQLDRLKKIQAEDKFGTVGAVARDKYGGLAAATSSGGIVDKKFGRVGDSAIPGAGTYANNKTCAVSCTGEGEYFIRNVCAYDVSALMEYCNWSINKSADFVIFDKLASIHGSGGLIALDSDGSFCAPFNTPGMFRANIDSNGVFALEVFK